MATHMFCVFALLVAAGEAHVAHIKDHSVTVYEEFNPPSKSMDIKTLEPLPEDNPFTNKSDAIELLDLIYEGHAKHTFWKVNDYHGAVQEVNHIAEDPQAILYGEIVPATFIQMLSHIEAKPGQQFYDLGSGTGKAVFAAWILGLNATGVEIVQPRWRLACEMSQRLHRLGFRKPADGPGVTFVHEDFTKTDLIKADIIFINSKMFTQDMMKKLSQAESHIKPGAKIISTMGLPGKRFRTDEKVTGPTSWSLGTTWIIQTALAHPEGAGADTAGDKKLVRKEPKEVKESLIEQEIPHHPHGPVQGPVYGEVRLPAAPSNLETISSNTCSLEEGETSGSMHSLLKAGALVE